MRAALCSGLGKPRGKAPECVYLAPPRGQNPPLQGEVEAAPCLLGACWARWGPLPLPASGLGLTPIPGAGSWLRSHFPPCQGAGCAVPPSPHSGRGVTLQVSRRVQIFLVSGFTTPHCLLRSHSFPVGKVVPMIPKATSRRPTGRSGLFLPEAWEEGGPKAGEPLASSLGLQPFQRRSSDHRQLSAGHQNHPVPFPRPGTLPGTPRPQEDKTRNKSSCRHLGCQGNQLQEASGVLDLGEKRGKGQPPQVAAWHRFPRP